MITWIRCCQEGRKYLKRLRKCISSGESPVFTDVSRFMSKDLRHAYGCKGSPDGAYRSAGPDRRAVDAYGYFSGTDMLQRPITKPPDYCRQ